MLKVPVAENDCAFHVKADDNVCSDDFTLDKMKEFIAKLDPSENIRSLKKEEIIDRVKDLTGCDSEICILKNKEFANHTGSFALKETIKNRFKPEGPADSKEWLSNDNIDEVLDQWAVIHKDFLHIPFQMVDFDERNTELAKTDLVEEYEKGIRKVGCVINTDRSTGRGIHWFCIFIDMCNEKKWTLEYFDSAGEYPKLSVHKWLNQQRAKLAEKYPDKNIQVIDVTKRNQLQKSTSECGVFSLWYIRCRLGKVPHTYFSQPNSSTDDMMYKFRKYLFR